MNPRMFNAQQNKGWQNSAEQPAHSRAQPSMATQQSREQRQGSKNIADARRSTPPVAPLSLAEQDSLLRQNASYEIKQGNYGAAIALFSALLERNPQNVNDYNNRGLLYFQNGQFANALADYNAALELNPRLAKIYNNRANCYASMGRPMEALYDYETALDLNPTNTHARINQGITFRELEMYEHAIETFDLALQFDQMLSGAETAQAETAHTMTSIAGHIYAQRGRTSQLAGDWNYAVADYRRALAVLAPGGTAFLDVSQRLRLQVQSWLIDLLEPQLEA